MQCHDFRELADSYMGDELLVETNHELLAHLEACAACRRELAARRALRDKLRASFARAPELRMRDEFGEQLRASLRARALGDTIRPGARRRAWLAIAATVVVAVFLGLAGARLRQHAAAGLAGNGAVRSHDRAGDTAGSPATRAGANTATGASAAEYVRLAVGDHQNCAVKFALPEDPIDLDEAGHKYDNAYVDLRGAVAAALKDSPDSIKLLEAHSCVFEGRRFGHVVLRYRDHIVSLQVTGAARPGAGDASAGDAGRASARSEQGVMSCSRSGGYSVSCFETARHAVYVVSDLSEAKNLSIARDLAPAVSAHVAAAEGAV